MNLLMPLQSRGFRVIFSRYPEFTDHVQDCELDLLNKKLTVKVRQSISPDTYELITEAVKYSRPPQIEFTYCSETQFALTMVKARLVKHELVLSYADDGPMMHHLEWDFDDCMCLEPASSSPSVTPSVADPLWPTPDEAIKNLKMVNE